MGMLKSMGMIQHSHHNQIIRYGHLEWQSHKRISTKTWEWPTVTTCQHDELTPYTRFTKTPKNRYKPYINHTTYKQTNNRWFATQIIPARDPKQYAVRIRGKGGKDLKSSVAASYQDQSDPSSEKKRYQIAGQLLSIPAENISVDRAQDLLERFCRSVRLSRKVAVTDLKVRSLSKLSREAAAQDPYVSLSVQVSLRDLHKRSLWGISK